MDVAPNLHACMSESPLVALCTTDGEGQIAPVNPALERLWGWRPSGR